MALAFEDLAVLQEVEKVADAVWKQVVGWEHFQRDTVGKQLVRAVDSIGANVAEAYGRYHYSEKLQFLYYARGSLFETKYWLNRTKTRQLLSPNTTLQFISDITRLARQLNALAKSTKQQKYTDKSKQLREPPLIYQTTIQIPEDFMERPELFDEEDLNFLQTME